MPTIMDIFNQDPFRVVEYNDEVIRKIDFKPQLLGSLNLFRPIYSRSRTVMMVKEGKSLSLIPTSATGAPPVELDLTGKDARAFRTTRLAKSSTIYAEELQGLAALPGDMQLRDAQTEVADRTAQIMDDMELTWEHMRLGAVLGIVYDSNGSTVINNWFTEWGISQPAEVDFALSTDATDVRQKCRNIKRAMQKAAKGVWTPSTRVAALTGDNFYDALVNHPKIKETKIGTEKASLLENIEGFSAIEIEGITFINYRGTDDGTTLAVDTDKAKFFPIGANGAFQVAWAPAEFFPFVNQRGQEKYGLIIPDEKRNAFVQVEMYSYPLYICTRPEMLLRAKKA